MVLQVTDQEELEFSTDVSRDFNTGQIDGTRPRRRRKRIAAKFRRLTKERLRANERERQRAHALKEGFEALRDCLPVSVVLETDTEGIQLGSGTTRFELLLTAMRYIQELEDLNENDGVMKPCTGKERIICGSEEKCGRGEQAIMETESEGMETSVQVESTMSGTRHSFCTGQNETDFKSDEDRLGDSSLSSSSSSSSSLSSLSSGSSDNRSVLRSSSSSLDISSLMDLSEVDALDGDTLFHRIPAVENDPGDIFDSCFA